MNKFKIGDLVTVTNPDETTKSIYPLNFVFKISFIENESLNFPEKCIFGIYSSELSLVIEKEKKTDLVLKEFK